MDTAQEPQRSSPHGEFARVAISVPVLRGFHYRVPSTLSPQPMVGDRVRVFFRGRSRIGTVIGFDSAPEVERVLDVQEVLGIESRIPGPIIELCRWVSEKFGASLGETLEAALPPPLRRGGKIRRIAHVSLDVEDRSEGGIRELVEKIEKRAPKQARALRILAQVGGSAEEREIRRLAHLDSNQPLRGLETKGLIRRIFVEGEPEEVAGDSAEQASPPPLTAEQELAVASVRLAMRRSRPQGFLLFGVTGSGKTEVYLRALQEAVQAGKQGIVLVPEIALTPQTVARFRSRFPRIAVLHSRLTERERVQAWGRIRSGEVDVVVGARSAIFAPVPKLGLLVMDEEHEPSFKQQSPPRYHARDVARKRAELEGAIVILGSATPSLESFVAAQQGELSLLRLPNRVGGGVLPETAILDLGSLPFQKVPSALSAPMKEQIHRTLQRGEQAILFLNRRGFARVNVCMACRESVQCQDCSVSLVLHRRAGRLLCHLCGHEQSVPTQCPNCEAPGMRALGFGTERVEEELRRNFPQARVARMDSDTTGTRGSHERILADFGKGELDLLIGTQMIAKGLDFPRVTLVGIIFADTSLSLPDYRGAERTFQLVAQVAGRAGRSDRGGRVLVQTFQPHHPAILAAVEHDYEKFVKGELQERQETLYPPFAQLLRILISHPEEERGKQTAQEVRERLESAGRVSWGILGPAACPIPRVRGRSRFQILVKTEKEDDFRDLVSYARSRVMTSAPVRVTLDVDPVSLL